MLKFFSTIYVIVKKLDFLILFLFKSFNPSPWNFEKLTNNKKILFTFVYIVDPSEDFQNESLKSDQSIIIIIIITKNQTTNFEIVKTKN